MKDRKFRIQKNVLLLLSITVIFAALLMGCVPSTYGIDTTPEAMTPSTENTHPTTPGETMQGTTVVPETTVPNTPATTPAPDETHVHIFSTQVSIKEPTCDSEGSIVLACKCGETKAETTPRTNHEYRPIEQYEATCTHPGYITYRCLCDDVKQEEIPQLNHTYVNPTRVEPTCTQEGYIQRTCECGDTTKEVLTKTPHSYSETSRVHATCTAEGKIIKSCVCGNTKIETLEKTKHHFVYYTTIDATCTETGKVINRCVCGAETTKTIAILDHKYVETARVAATCTSQGKITLTCSCGAVKYNTIKKVDHAYVLTETVESTTTVHGKKVYTCKNCPDSYTEKLDLKPKAMYTDMCGESLINKALPHDENYELAQKIFAMIHAGYDDDAARDHRINLEGYNKNAVLNWYHNKYRYASILYWYTIYSYDNKPSEFLVWGEEEIWVEMEQVEAEVQRVLKELKIDNTVTQYEAIQRINDYICESMYYQDNPDCRDGSVIHSMIGEWGVCHNYALRFQMLCLGAGIECEYYSSNTMNHAWNKVIFSDGESYWVDVCWNDVRYQFRDGTVVETSVANGVPEATVKRLRARYLLVTTEQLLQDHTL